MKVVSTEALTKLIQLVKSAFIKVEDVVETSEVTLADVATSGDYDDLINKPIIPTATSDLTNDSGYITNSALSGYATETWVGNQGYITDITSSDVTTALGYTPYNSSNPNGYITSSALSGYEQTSNKVTSISSSSTDSQYPSAKCVYDIVGDIEVDIDEIATDLNNKLDKNDLTPVHCVIETYQNGTSWYRVYDDGWCEQGGVVTLPNSTVNLLKTFNNNTYTALANPNNNTTGWPVAYITSKTNSTLFIDGTGDHGSAARTITVSWVAYGYIS